MSALIGVILRLAKRAEGPRPFIGSVLEAQRIVSIRGVTKAWTLAMRAPSPFAPSMTLCRPAQ